MAELTISVDRKPVKETGSQNPLPEKVVVAPDSVPELRERADLCEPREVLDEFVVGYPRMAARMGLIPETAMFRRFRTLNCRNMLYL
jgi:hypothetical protein